ncbi:MAG: hypothetical protein GY720_03195, partial [bacterium]|nr:hypothetical protein [bacterium]
MNSLRWCFLPLLLAAAVTSSGEPIVIGETTTLTSQVLGEERILMIHLPDGYAGSQASYPVLYLLDGSDNFHHTVGTIHSLARTGHVPAMIVVALPNTDRNRDLTPGPDLPEEETGEVRLPTAGGADDFLRFFSEELIPHVESTYRTAPFKILVGHSLGGLFAVHALTAAPESFDAYIAISPSMQWRDGEPVKTAESFFRDHPDLEKYLFVSVASEGGSFHANNQRFSELLRHHAPPGLVWNFRQMEGDDHGSTPVRSTYLALRMIFPRWRAPGSMFEQGVEAFEQHYRRLSDEYGFEIEVPERTVNALGYRALGQNELAKAIEIFERNVTAFPHSANVYDSLGEAQEKAGDFEAALKNYEQA